MSMIQETVGNAMLAFATITGATGAAVSARNCTTARSAAGVYTVTLPGGGINAANCIIAVEPRTATSSGLWSVVHTSDTVKTIRLWTDAGVAADIDFAVSVKQIF